MFHFVVCLCVRVCVFVSLSGYLIERGRPTLHTNFKQFPLLSLLILLYRPIFSSSMSIRYSALFFSTLITSLSSSISILNYYLFFQLNSYHLFPFPKLPTSTHSPLFHLHHLSLSCLALYFPSTYSPPLRRSPRYPGTSALDTLTLSNPRALELSPGNSNI